MTDKPRFFYGYTVVIISFFMMMVIMGLHACFGIFFKPIIEELGWTRTVTSGAYSLSQIVGGLLGIVMGGLNDRLGPRVVMTLCGLLTALGYILMWQTHAVWQLYLFYGILIGVSVAVFTPLLSTVARWFIQRRGMMTGVVMAGAGVGMIILPLLINWLIFAYNWRIACLILGIVILIVVVLTAQFLKRDPSKVGQAAYGESDTVEEGLKLGTKGFSAKEAMLTRQFWLFFATLICYGFCIFSIQVHIAPYATDIGISTTNAAIILSTIGGASIIGQIGLGSAGDKIGYKRTFLIGLVLIVLAIFTLILAKELWAFFLFAILLGVAFGNCSTQESPIVAWLFGLASHGVLLGFLVFSFTIGAAIGPVVFGYIFDVTGNYQLAFLVYAAISIVAIILTILLKPPTSESTLKTINSKALQA